MLKTILIIIAIPAVLFLLFIIFIIIRVIKGSRSEGKIKNETDYINHCTNYGHIYIPNRSIREQMFGKQFIYEYSDLNIKTSHVNIGMTGEGRIFESLQALASAPSFESITFYQTYSTGDDQEYCGFKYEPITKETILGFTDINDDESFLNWLYSHKAIAIDPNSYQPVDTFEVNAVAIPVKHFGTTVIDEFPSYKITNLGFGQGYLSFDEFKRCVEKFDSLKVLWTNYIQIEDIESKQLEEYLIDLCNRKNLDSLKLHLTNKLDVDHIKSKLTVNTNVDYNQF